MTRSYKFRSRLTWIRTTSLSRKLSEQKLNLLGPAPRGRIGQRARVGEGRFETMLQSADLHTAPPIVSQNPRARGPDWRFANRNHALAQDHRRATAGSAGCAATTEQEGRGHRASIAGAGRFSLSIHNLLIQLP